MQRYFLDSNDSFTKDDIHHITTVMRSKTNDIVEVCKDGICHASKLTIEGKIVTFERLEKLADNFTKDITIIQGLPKGEKLDTVTKYATLFGARNIIFTPMHRSIAKLSNIEHKIERLLKISKEAAELSKRSEVPHVSFIESLKHIDPTNAILLVADEYEKVKTLKSMINELENKKIIVVIGPEGGIDEKDRIILNSKGAIYISLGLTILPTELAHIPILNALY